MKPGRKSLYGCFVLEFVLEDAHVVGLLAEMVSVCLLMDVRESEKGLVLLVANQVLLSPCSLASLLGRETRGQLAELL